jgi:HAD superfamily hydrolase (TIGR01458 family)
MMAERIEGILIDVDGVLHIGDQPIAGAAEAVGRLQESGLPIHYVTNTTRVTRQGLVDKLLGMGFGIDASSLFTAPIATRKYVLRHRFRPYWLIHPNLQEEFADVPCDAPNAVVVGDAADAFTYRTLNEAFRILTVGGALIAMGSNKYFREPDGLSLDMGPFVEALRFASGAEPLVIGKPSASFFQLALDDMKVPASRAVMIGDDLENDIGGAQASGIQGILVQTGKYRPADELHESIKPNRIMRDIAEAVDALLKMWHPL